MIREAAARAAIQAIALGVGGAIFLGTLGVAFAPRLLALMGASPAVLRIGSDYTRVMLGGEATIVVLFVVNAANQSSSEGMQNLNLLEGSMEPSIYLRLQQKGFSQKLSNIPLTEYPIYTTYTAEVTRWRYNPATRIVSAYVKGFRMSNTISGKGGMEKYRAMIEIFWEPMSNRNKWGYYIQRFDEFYGAAAEAYDTELKNRDRSGF